MILDFVIRQVIGALSPAGEKARLSIFIFHRVLSKPDPLFPNEPDAVQFDRIVSWIKAWFQVIPLNAAVDSLKTAKLPARAAAITFDDGYADNHDVALPILIKHNVPATFFIATGYLDGGRMWNDTITESIRQFSPEQLDLSGLDLGCHPTGNDEQKRKAIGEIIEIAKYLAPKVRQSVSEEIARLTGALLPTDLMMTSDQIRNMRAAGMQIGAHTVNHPILACTEKSIAQHEISASKASLEELLGEEITLFAYPNGKPLVDYLPEHAQMIEDAGFHAALSTAWGSAKRDTDIFQIPRYTPWNKTPLKFAIRLIQNLQQRTSR
jgi:peptidoglycan/xylan/chitin deacetylase (PgdA/CDA1 family)